MGYPIVVVESVNVESEIMNRPNFFDAYACLREQLGRFITFYDQNRYEQFISTVEIKSVLEDLLKLEIEHPLWGKLRFILLYRILSIKCVRREMESSIFDRMRRTANEKLDYILERDSEFGAYIQEFFNRF